MTGRTIALGLVAFVATRVLLAAACADVFGYGEEFAKGAAAKAMLDGLDLPHHRLTYVYHEGGGFVVSHLTALLFLALGPSVLAVKLAALTVSTLVLAAALGFVSEHLDRRALGAVALAFVLAPLGVQRASLLSLGTHFAAMLFVLLVLRVALRIARRARGEPCPASDAWTLGLCSGFGLYVSALLVPAVAVAGVVLVVARVGRRVALHATAAFALGALPLWSMLALVGTDALRVRSEAGVVRPSPSTAESLRALFGPIALSRDLWVWFAAAATVALALVGLARASRALRAVVLGYLALHAAAFVASGLAVHYYSPDLTAAWLLELRLVPLWLFGVLLAAAGAAHLWGTGGAAGRLGGAAFLLVLAPGAQSFAALLRDARPDRPFANLRLLASLRGYSYHEYFAYFVGHLDGGAAERTQVLLRFDDDPALVVPSVAEHVHLEAWTRAPETLVRDAREAFGEHADLALLAAGRALHGGWARDFERAFERVRAQPVESHQTLAEALGRGGVRDRWLAEDLDPQLAVEVPDHLRAAYLEGVGWRASQVLRYRPDLAERWLEGQEPATREALRAGYERGRALDRR
ncbi:MAG TPA: hypothetical protein VMT18_15030 [Planctomycetota bacterium]|nr:hypothetical protein [Planctomycetota bacterium]